MGNCIEVKNLTKSFEYYKKEEGVRGSVKNFFHRKKLIKESVRNVSFNIEESEFVGFLGPNGAGKTTTLKMLSGILFPTTGEIDILGYTPWERKDEFKRQFSIIMGQKNQLWWDLPAKESLYLNKCIYGISDEEYKKTINMLAALLEVGHVMDVQVRRLSLGERMKLEIIAALLHKPKIIFLDEPTIGLDMVSQKNIRNFLKYYNKEYKATILLTSHYMKDIEDLCSRIIVINEGSIVYDGKNEDINSIYNNKKIISLKFSDEVEAEMLKEFGRLRKCDRLEAEIEVEKDAVKDLLWKVTNSLPINDFSISDIPLEEGLERLYAKK
ncbi:ABC transporter ATP-binding protein [Acetivibrio ethanolgignens]|uniref:Multidrug ABC transporter ATP-binding protein n=1 Tax=Acetivibrio ethanolgignens TaxID=290052 RepID=A0A0V8QF33_9FIRM|nr:ABC transporter ATP-binding protein [Acetivibrio ethanolgignens]KSV59211.1 multidrug ABC transporter ATP-binding protein [Acetivibrio ethanolgignens]